MRALLTVCVVLAVGGFSRADEEQPKFYLNSDRVTVEQRVDKVEAEVAALKARLAALEGKSAGPKVTTIGQTGPGTLGTSPQTFQLNAVGPVNPNWKPSASAPTPAVQMVTQRVQVCENGRCRMVDIQVPVQQAAASSSCPTGPCGDNCGCVSQQGFSAVQSVQEASVGSRRQNGGGPLRRIFGFFRSGGGQCGN